MMLGMCPECTVFTFTSFFKNTNIMAHFKKSNKVCLDWLVPLPVESVIYVIVMMMVMAKSSLWSWLSKPRRPRSSYIWNAVSFIQRLLNADSTPDPGDTAGNGADLVVVPVEFTC